MNLSPSSPSAAVSPADFRSRLALGNALQHLAWATNMAGNGKDVSSLIMEVVDFVKFHNADLDVVRASYTFLLTAVRQGSPQFSSVVDAICKVLDSPSSPPTVKALSLRALGNLPPTAQTSEELSSRLLGLLQSPQPLLRSTAIKCLPRTLAAFRDGLLPPSKLPWLRTYLEEVAYCTHDDRPEVQAAAYVTLFESCRAGLFPPVGGPTLAALLKLEAQGKLQKLLDLIGMPTALEGDKASMLDLVAASLEHVATKGLSSPSSLYPPVPAAPSGGGGGAGGGSDGMSTVLFNVTTCAIGLVNHVAPSVVFAALRLLFTALVLLQSRPKDTLGLAEEELALSILTRVGPPLKSLASVVSCRGVQMQACQALRLLHAFQPGISLGLPDVPALLPKHEDPPLLTCEKLLASCAVANQASGLSGAISGEGDEGREARALLETLLRCMDAKMDPVVVQTAARLLGSVGFDLSLVLEEMEQAASQILAGTERSTFLTAPTSAGGPAASPTKRNLSPDGVLLALRELLLRHPQSTLAPSRVGSVVSALCSVPSLLSPLGKATASFLASVVARYSPESATSVLQAQVDRVMEDLEEATDLEVLELLTATARFAVTMEGAAGGVAADRSLFASLSELCLREDAVLDPLVRGRAVELSRLLALQSTAAEGESGALVPYPPSSGHLATVFEAPLRSDSGVGVVDPVVGTMDRTTVSQLLCSVGKGSVLVSLTLSDRNVSKPRPLKTGKGAKVPPHAPIPIPAPTIRESDAGKAAAQQSVSFASQLQFGGRLDLGGFRTEVEAGEPAVPASVLTASTSSFSSDRRVPVQPPSEFGSEPPSPGSRGTPTLQRMGSALKRLGSRRDSSSVHSLPGINVSLEPAPYHNYPPSCPPTL